MKKKSFQGIGFYMVLLLILIVAFMLANRQEAPENKTYFEIVKLFENEQVEEFLVDGKNLLRIKLYGQAEDEAPLDIRIRSLDLFLSDTYHLIKEQSERGIIKDYDFPAPDEIPWWMSILPYLLLIIVFVLLWMFLLNQQGGGGGKVMSFGRAKAKLLTDEQKKKNFTDVAGADEEKEELKEVVDFLKDPRRFVEIGARIPKGILMIGPPGTGKTLLAKAVAGEAGVPFFSISGSDFVEMFVGVGASRVRDLFDQAKKNSPCIIFIDEIDAVGRHRGAGLGGGHDEREQTLNQLLVEMDGFGINEGVIVVAATNRVDILDPALLRPGRFDRQVYVSPPDMKGREEILKVHGKGKPFEDGVDLAVIAKTTSGFTGAELENLLNEAALLAARQNKKKIGMKEIEDATIKVIVGPEKKSRKITEEEKKLTAYHEAGHALATRHFPGQDPVHQISIIPRGLAGGFTLSLPSEDRYYRSKNKMLEDVVILLGGRVAEKIALDDISTGASNDIERATNIIRKMITRYGMSELLGPIMFGQAHEEVFLGRDFGSSKNYSEEIAAQIDSEVKRMIDEAYVKCEELLRKDFDKLDTVARALLAKEKLDGEEFEYLMQGGEIDVVVRGETPRKEKVEAPSEDNSEAAKTVDVLVEDEAEEALPKTEETEENASVTDDAKNEDKATDELSKKTDEDKKDE